MRTPWPPTRRPHPRGADMVLQKSLREVVGEHRGCRRPVGPVALPPTATAGRLAPSPCGRAPRRASTRRSSRAVARPRRTGAPTVSPPGAQRSAGGTAYWTNPRSQMEQRDRLTQRHPPAGRGGSIPCPGARSSASTSRCVESSAHVDAPAPRNDRSVSAGCEDARRSTDQAAPRCRRGPRAGTGGVLLRRGPGAGRGRPVAHGDRRAPRRRRQRVERQALATHRRRARRGARAYARCMSDAAWRRTSATATGSPTARPRSRRRPSVAPRKAPRPRWTRFLRSPTRARTGRSGTSACTTTRCGATPRAGPCGAVARVPGVGRVDEIHDLTDQAAAGARRRRVCVPLPAGGRTRVIAWVEERGTGGGGCRGSEPLAPPRSPAWATLTPTALVLVTAGRSPGSSSSPSAPPPRCGALRLG